MPVKFHIRKLMLYREIRCYLCYLKMKPDFKICLCGIIFLFCLNVYKSNSQILSDTSSLKIIERCISDIYNFRFRDASVKCKDLNSLYSGHPAIRLLHGMEIYWEFYPMLPKSPFEKIYLDDMNYAILQSEKKEHSGYETEYLLINLCARGMLMQYYADIDNDSEIFPLVKNTYQHIRKAFRYTSGYSDFYFFTGLYNYYREAYPEAYPIYKTFAFLFPRGNKEAGIKQMQIASRQSLLLKAESYSFLAWISTSFEHDYQSATNYSRMLCDLYPDNTLYLAEYIKNLLLTKQYNEAEKLLSDQSKENNSPFLIGVFKIFSGILQEKEYHNNKEAKKMYEKGIVEIHPFSSYGNEYAAYAYFGLSRISEAMGDKRARKTYHKKAIDLAVFKNIDFGN
jgi:hypothetical protein